MRDAHNQVGRRNFDEAQGDLGEEGLIEPVKEECIDSIEEGKIESCRSARVRRSDANGGSEDGGPSTSAATTPVVATAPPPKEMLLSKLGSSGRALTSGSKADRVAVAELLPLVERDNPTPSPASSSKLEGKWLFRYCG